MVIQYEYKFAFLVPNQLGCHHNLVVIIPFFKNVKSEVKPVKSPLSFGNMSLFFLSDCDVTLSHHIGIVFGLPARFFLPTGFFQDFDFNSWHLVTSGVQFPILWSSLNRSFIVPKACRPLLSQQLQFLLWFCLVVFFFCAFLICKNVF